MHVAADRSMTSQRILMISCMMNSCSIKPGRNILPVFAISSGECSSRSSNTESGSPSCLVARYAGPSSRSMFSRRFRSTKALISVREWGHAVAGNGRTEPNTSAGFCRDWRGRGRSNDPESARQRCRRVRKNPSRSSVGRMRRGACKAVLQTQCNRGRRGT